MELNFLFYPASAITHPAEDQHNQMDRLSAVVNRVQRHHCTEAYCLRKEKATGNIVCRFNYPQALREEPTVAKPIGNTYLRFLSVRNDGRLNNYNCLMTLSWLTNTDIALYTGARAVLDYIGKYCTKAEHKYETYRQVIQQILTKLATTKPLLSLVSRTMNKLIGERDGHPGDSIF
jgi:hypothetical protein